MFRTLLLSCVVTAAASDLLAQAITIPAGLVTPGSSNQTSNWRGSRRHQIVLDPRALPPINRVLQGLVLHGDDGPVAGLVAQLDVTVLVSSLGVPLPTRIDPNSYANNLGSDATVVVQSLRINIPQTPGATVTLPFAQPFAYQNGNPLLIQLEFTPVVTPQVDNPTWILDSHDLPSTFWTTSGNTTGPACTAPGQWTVMSDGIHDALTFRWGMAATSQPQLGAMLFGFSDQWFGVLPLPLDLSLFGMPGCALRTSMDAALVTSSIPGGGSSWFLQSARVPRDPRLSGLDLYAQVMVFAPGANVPGLQFSELRHEQLQTPPAPILASRAMGPFSSFFPNDVPEIVYRNNTLVLGLQ